MAVKDLMNKKGQSPYSEIPTGTDKGIWDSIKKFFLGNPEVLQMFNQFDPQQQQVLSQLLNSGTQDLKNPYQGFEPIAQEELRQFNTEAVPGLAERFTSLGQGAQNSSAFAGALGSSRAQLGSQLAALRAQYGQQNKANALQQLQTGLTPQ